MHLLFRTPIPVRLSRDTGSVTAEFVLILPTVIAVLLFSLGALNLQVERIRLFVLAADAARAAARGESPSGVKLIAERDLICAEVTAGNQFGFELTERACARSEAL